MVLSLAAGCATNGDLQVEVSRLRRELHDLKKQVAKTEEAIRGLEAQPDAPVASPPAPERSSPSGRAASPRTGPPRALPVVRLGSEGRVEVARRSDQAGAEDRGEPPVLIRVRGDRADRLSVDREVLARPDPVLDAAKEQPEALYQGALDALRRDKDPASALEQFRTFLKAHPHHSLAANAQYWTGESLQVLVRHEEAVAAFLRLLHDHPRSEKVPWALLRASESEQALGRSEAGQFWLERLRTDHPDSEPAKLAAALSLAGDEVHDR
jgi:tol-pal system protein YbgF